MSSQDIALLVATGCLGKVKEFLPDDLWEYTAVVDWRCCDACLELDGVFFTTSQISRAFPYAIFNPLLIYPMVHPHCRCALVLQEREPPVEPELPPGVVVPRAGEPEVYIEKPLTQAQIDKTLRALQFKSPYGEPEPFSVPSGEILPDYSSREPKWYIPWKERFLKKKHQRIR